MNKILFLLLCLSGSLQAQIPLEWSIGPSVSANFFQRGRLNDFINSYNSYYDQNYPGLLNQPFKTISGRQMGWGWNTNLKFVGDKASTGLYFHQDIFQQKRESYFTNNWGRALLLEFRDWSAGVSFGLVWERMSVDLLLGVGTRRTNVQSLLIYPDGSRSIGSEYLLNGYYRMQRTSLNIGIAYQYHIKPWLGLRLRVEYFSPGVREGREHRLYLYALRDNHRDQVSAAYLPQDFGLWMQNLNNIAYDNSSNIIPAYFYGFNASLSLLFKINLLQLEE